MSRARHEASIKRLDTTFGCEFELALDRVISRWRGLSFFTDEQIAEIRAEMVQTEWDRRRRMRAYRQTTGRAA